MNTKKLTALAMLSAIAFVMTAFVRVPVVLFLRYDPKDIIIVIGGFIFGPMAAFAITVVVAVIQMFTVSQTGPWGLLMNIIASGAFCCTAAYIYQKNRTMKGAVYGLVAGFFVSTAAMMFWNYIVTPLYMGVPRADVVRLLLPAILPFNLIKNGINVALSILLYKHVKNVLKMIKLLPSSTESDSPAKFNIGILIATVFVLVTCVLWVLMLQGIL